MPYNQAKNQSIQLDVEIIEMVKLVDMDYEKAIIINNYIYISKHIKKNRNMMNKRKA